MRAIPLGRLAAAVAAGIAAVAVLVAGLIYSDSYPAPAEAGPPVPKAQQAQQEPGKYVALGSSFAAGPGSGEPVGRCGQTHDNYPRRVADALNLKLDDASCSGAVVADILRPSSKGHPPQIEAVTPDTSLVTVTIGGNDVSYIGRLATSACANLAAGLFSPPLGRYCNTAAWPSPFPVADRYSSVERDLADVVAAIRDRAPEARVVFVDYPPVVSVNEGPCPALPLEPWQVAETESVGAQLAAATARAAEATGAQLVSTAQAGAGHTVCSAEPWIRGYGQSMAFHPNSAGKAAVADQVVRTLR
ncbi:SGNH/GDSL hydrolase family protein [Gordonia caeni]